MTLREFMDRFKTETPKQPYKFPKPSTPAQEVERIAAVARNKELRERRAQDLCDRRDWVEACSRLQTLLRALDRIEPEKMRLESEIRVIKARIARLEAAGVKPQERVPPCHHGGRYSQRFYIPTIGQGATPYD